MVHRICEKEGKAIGYRVFCRGGDSGPRRMGRGEVGERWVLIQRNREDSVEGGEGMGGCEVGGKVAGW